MKTHNKKMKVFELTSGQKEELDKRFSDYQNGIGKIFTRDEPVVIAKQVLAGRKK